MITYNNDVIYVRKIRSGITLRKGYSAVLNDEVFSFFGAKRYFEDFGEEYSGEGAARLLGLSPQIAESRFLYLYRSLS